jgi:LPS export ABC transporter protein LptC
MRRTRNLLVLCVVAVALVVAVFLVMNWRKAGLSRTVGALPRIKADLEVGNLVLAEEKGGTVVWELKAKIAQSFKDAKRMILEDLQVTLYTEEGRVVTLCGNRGRIDETTRDMDVEGEVVVTSSDGLCLETSSLRYDHGRQEVRTEAPVQINGRGVTVSGMGLLMDLSTERISILGGVNTLIRGDPGSLGS